MRRLAIDGLLRQQPLPARGLRRTGGDGTGWQDDRMDRMGTGPGNPVHPVILPSCFNTDRLCGSASRKRPMVQHEAENDLTIGLDPGTLPCNAREGGDMVEVVHGRSWDGASDTRGSSTPIGCCATDGESDGMPGGRCAGRRGWSGERGWGVEGHDAGREGETCVPSPFVAFVPPVLTHGQI